MKTDYVLHLDLPDLRRLGALGRARRRGVALIVLIVTALAMTATYVR